MPEFEVVCIVKIDHLSKYDRIQSLGVMTADGRQIWPTSLIIPRLDRDFRLYVQGLTHRVYVRVAHRNFVPYLKTEADRDTPDNLLSLRACV